MNLTKTLRRWCGTALILAVCAPAYADPAVGSAGKDASTVGSEPPHNMCFGGPGDRKFIVPESQLDNPFRETTHLDCQIDGGRPTVMPDLPTPSTVRTVLA